MIIFSTVRVDWDKNSGSQGESTLHLLNEVSKYFDLYFLLRKKKLYDIKGDWLFESSTPFFLNSRGSAFGCVKMKHISDAIGKDVTSYHFRRIICTWALIHSNPLVRDSEAPALNHKPNVAEEVYRQNRATKPLVLVQQYNKEEGTISKEMKEDMKNLDPSLSKIIDDMRKEQETRHQMQLVQERETLMTQYEESKHLGPRHRISESNKKRLQDELKKAGIDVSSLTLNLTKSKFRQKIVREVCLPEAKELRNEWKVSSWCCL